MINFLNVQLKVNIIMMSALRKNHQYYPDRLNTNKKSTEELGIEDDGYYAEPEVDPKELKAQQKREKAEIKAKKKEKRKSL